ncbi:MAG: hypothetical protein K8S23_15295 [Candidatus Cloacimonetes bacterium]|nr:hypothetical protein [Candidatus Cloacimonadota bacterium]
MKLLSLIVLSLILLISCTKQNTNAPEESQLMQVTSFTGEKTTLENSSEYSYEQIIKWETNNEITDPVFAIRITTTDNLLPGNLTADENGWLRQNENNVWTDQNEFSQIFQSEDGELQHIISDVEIKYFADNEESKIFPVNFFKYREIGTKITSYGGHIDDCIIGTGTMFYLYENIEDIFVDGLYAEYFMYRLNTINATTNEIISEGDWYSSLDMENIRILYLNSFTTPALLPNNEEEKTQLQAYVVTKSGFEDVDNPNAISFTVMDGFYPETLIYLRNSYMLGDHHYITYYEANSSDEAPLELVDGIIHYATPFWKDLEENYVLIGGSDVDLNFRWGWSGEYVNDNPSFKKNDLVYDENTGLNYHSFITFMDVRFDGEPLSIEEFPAIDENLVTDDDGTIWLRIPKEYDFSQKVLLTGLDYGTHTLEVRAVDAQLKADETPVSFEFVMHEPVPPEEREGILVVNDGVNGQFAPPDELESLYREYLSSYNGIVDVIVRNEIEPSGLHFCNERLSPTDLQNYELVIYSMDYPADYYYFEREFGVLKIYTDLSGNLILSGGKNIQKSFYYDYLVSYNFPQDFWNIDNSSGQAAEYLGTNWLDKPYFIGANSENENFPDIEVRLPVLDWQPPYIDLRAGFSLISFFKEEFISSEIIYRMNCKPVGFDDFSPTQEEFDYYNEQPMAIKKDFGDHKCYLFGFPLAYMETEQVQEILTQIISEIQE